MRVQKISFAVSFAACGALFAACGSAANDASAPGADAEAGLSADAAPTTIAPAALDATIDANGQMNGDDDGTNPGGDDSDPSGDDDDASDGGIDCFDRASSATLPFPFLQQTQAPLLDGGDYTLTSPSYPASIYAFGTTDAMTQSSPVGASGYAFTKMAWEWSNRCLYMLNITPSTSDCRNGTGDQPASGDASSAGTLHPITTGKANWYFGVVTPPAADGGPGMTLFAGFSTYTKAHACTHLQIERALGVDLPTLTSEAKNADVSLVVGADAATLAPLAKTVSVSRRTTVGDASTSGWQEETMMVDTCVLEANVAAADSAGIVLDHEVGDFPTAEENSTYLEGLQRLVAASGKKLIVYTDALASYAHGPASSAIANGFTAASVRALLGVVDGFSPVVWSGATSGNPDRSLTAHARGWSYPQNYDAQVAYITGTGAALTAAEKRKILFAVALSDLDDPQPYADGGSPGADAGLAEAAYLHGAIAGGGYGGINLWKNYAATGGACDRPENQVVACLAFGACDGGYTGR